MGNLQRVRTASHAPAPKQPRRQFMLVWGAFVLAGCGRLLPARAPSTPVPTPAVTPEATTLYDVTQAERACPDYEEHRSFRKTVEQVRIVCPSAGTETVYFVDIEKKTITAVRKPWPPPP